MFEDIKSYCTSLREDADGYVAILKPEYAVDGMRTLLWRDDGWVTINGAHVLIDDKGVVIGGAGGKFNGKNFSPNAAKFYKKRKMVNAARQYRKMLGENVGQGRFSYNEAKEGINTIDKNLKRTYLTPEQKAKRKESLKKIRELDKKIKAAKDDKELKQLVLRRTIAEVNMPKDNKKTAAEREKLLKKRREYKNALSAYEKHFDKIERFKKKNPGVAELAEKLQVRDKRVEKNRVTAQVKRLERTLTDKQKQSLGNGTAKSWNSMSKAEKIIARKAQGMPDNMPYDMWDLYSNPLTVSRTSFGAVWTGDSAD